MDLKMSSFIRFIVLLCSIVGFVKGLPNEDASAHLHEVISESSTGRLSNHTSKESHSIEESHSLDDSAINIISRKNWGGWELKDEMEPRTKPADFAIISNLNKRCFNQSQCVGIMKDMKNLTMGTTIESFYIGEDGNIYEGRGWKVYSKAYRRGLEKYSIWITFLGTFREELPNAYAMKALDGLLDIAVKLGQLSPDYKIASGRVLYDHHYRAGERLLQELEGSDRYTAVIDLHPENKYDTFGQIPIVYREEWEAISENITKKPVSLPIEYIIVAMRSLSCYSREGCAHEMREEQMEGIHFNFYVSNDGFVYEGKGWDALPDVTIFSEHDKYMVVVFMGEYDKLSPSPRSITGFKKFLRFGKDLGKLAADCKIVSFKQFALEGTPMRTLHEEIEKMDGYTILGEE